MARTSRAKADSRRIALGEDLRIATARVAFEALAGAGKGAAAIEIDASAVERIDGAGLQALAAAIGRLSAAGVACKWGAVSPALAGAATLAGMGKVLALPTRVPNLLGHS